MMLTRPQKRSQPSICHDGDYYHSEHRLYCVEQVYGERVLIEDCGTGELFDVPASDLDRLAPTRPLGARRETDASSTTAGGEVLQPVRGR